VPPTSLPAGQMPSVAHKRVPSNRRARDMAIAHTHDHDAATSHDRHHDEQGGQLCPPCPCLPGPAPSVAQKSAMPDRRIHATCRDRDRAWPHHGPGGANCAPMSLSARANAPASCRSARCWIGAHAPPPALWRRSAAATTTYPRARNASATATAPIPCDWPDARATPTTHTAGLLQAVQSTQHQCSAPAAPTVHAIGLPHPHMHGVTRPSAMPSDWHGAQTTPLALRMEPDTPAARPSVVLTEHIKYTAVRTAHVKNTVVRTAHIKDTVVRTAHAKDTVVLA
jgi:hypothetical protein